MTYKEAEGEDERDFGPTKNQKEEEEDGYGDSEEDGSRQKRYCHSKEDLFGEPCRLLSPSLSVCVFKRRK